MIKKVLIDARMYGLENAGIGRYLINLLGNLKLINTKLNFVVLLRKKYFYQLNFPDNWKKVMGDYKHYSFSEQIFVPGIINKEKPDLAHFPHLNVPIFWNGKFVVTIHDLTMHNQGTDATTLPLPIYYLKRVPYLLASNIAVNRSQKIIVPTKTVSNDIVDEYKADKTKIEVIYEGLDSGKKNEIINESEILAKYHIKNPYFFYVGNAYPHKNLKRAIEAIVSLNKNRKEKVYLVLGGSRGIFTDRIKSEILNYDASDLVKHIGFVEDKDLSVLNKNSVGFLYPSLAEGFGLQGLEAMSAGTLLLCSEIGVFKEIYGDNAIYFNQLDFTSIAASMKFALTLEAKKREKMIKSSQQFITKYSWYKMAKETLQVYTSVI